MTVGRRVEDKSLGCSGGIPSASKGRFSALRPIGDGILQKSLAVESHNVKKVEQNSKWIKPCGEIQSQVRIIRCVTVIAEWQQATTTSRDEMRHVETGNAA